MNQAELSKALLDQIPEHHDVVAAVMTTYTVELEFLELDVVPLLLPGQIAFSANEQVKQFQVGEAMREYDLKLEVFCDERMFNSGERRSPQLDYLCHPVNLGNHAFHPKVIWLLIHPNSHAPESTAPKLLMAVGSNNLTQAGWWENIEVQHWETLGQGTHAPELLEQVRQDLTYLNQLRGEGGEIPSNWVPAYRDALGEILNFVEELEPASEPEPVWYFGFSPENKPSIPDFLKKHLPDGEAERLEIISPFFAENQDNQLEKSLCSFRHAYMMLPTEGDSERQLAVCSGDYLYNIDSRDSIDWSDWAADFNVLTPDKTQRTLHAKLFHFQYAAESWLLVGSVNFTYKALHDNAEAAFLLKDARRQPFLKPLDDGLPDVVEDALEQAPGIEAEALSAAPPPVTGKVTFDWQSGQSRILLQRDDALAGKPVLLQLRDDANNLLLQRTNVTEDDLQVNRSDSSVLARHLKNSGFVILHIEAISDGSAHEGWCRDILVQQVNRSFKPRKVPKLTVQEILAIYAGLPEQQRQNLIQQAQMKLVLQEYGRTEYAEPDMATNPYSEFFCEYAQIFESFAGLQRNLRRYEDQDRTHQLDYYLTAQGVDSLPSLVRAASRSQRTTEAPVKEEDPEQSGDTGAHLPGVSSYLILLSARQLLHQYQQRPGVSELLARVNQEIAKIKSNGCIRIDEQSLDGQKDKHRPERFFDWFETMFDLPVQQNRSQEDSPS